MMQTLYVGERDPVPEPLPPPGSYRSFIPASERELLRLWSIVRSTRPEFCRCDDMRAFAIAFGFCQHIGRAAAVNRKVFCSHWGELGERWAKSIGAPAQNVDVQVFAAALASADIPYQLPSMGWGAALGLVEFGGRKSDQVEVGDHYGGKTLIRCTPRWKQLLAGEVQLLPPTEPPPLPNGNSEAQTRIVSGGRLYSSHSPWEPAWD
jgi:hypothetical protein